MVKLFVVFAFFITTPFVILFSLFFLIVLSSQKQQVQVLSASTFNPKAELAQQKIPETKIEPFIEQMDPRVEKIIEFFVLNNSPLTEHAKDIVDAADKYGIDYRLLPAIAMQESNLCKKTIKDSFNCWGFGIYGKKVTKFDNYQEAIETVSKTLALYKNTGLETPTQIQPKYNPSNTNNWHGGVTHFMEKLQIATNNP